MLPEKHNISYLSGRFNRTSPSDELKISVVVSKKSYARAVDRNKLKRRVRAIVSKHLKRISSGHLIIFVKKGALKISFKELEKSVLELCQGIF